MRDADLAWLAGIIDGEGCLYARFVPETYKHKPMKSMEVRFEIQVVSSRMVDAVCSLYDQLGVRYIRSAPTFVKLSTRPAIKLRVNRKWSLQTLLRAVLPYLVVKQAEVERALVFLDAACLVHFYDLKPEDLTLPDDLKALKRVA